MEVSLIDGQHRPQAQIMGANVRFANMDDREAILPLLRAMHAEVGPFGMNEEKVRDGVESCIKHGLVCLAISRGGEIVGTLGMQWSQTWYSDDWHLSERWFFVHPDHRASRHAVALMRAMNDAGKEYGFVVLCGVMTTKETQRKCEFFARYGRMIGQFYVMGDLSKVIERE